MVKRKFLTSPRDPFVTSDVSDAQNCGKTQILSPCAVVKPSDPFVTSDVSDAQNCGKTQILRLWPGNPLVTSCVSDVQNCGKMDIFDRTKPDYGEKLR